MDNLQKFEQGFTKTDGCWEWEKGLTPKGYGQISLEGKVLRTHRVAYTFYKGKIPSDLIVRHTCNNRKCVNPDHLVLGSHADNSTDREISGNTARGESHGKSKLTEEDKQQIRILLARGDTHKSISALFGVAPQTISKISSREH